jgi:DNA-binding transcriptional MocR family regulator
MESSTELLRRRPRSLALELVEALGDRIRDGRLAAGAKLPTEAEFAAKLDTRRPPTKLPELKATEADLAKFPAKSAAGAAQPAAPAGPVTYPPLEATR